MKRLDKVKAEEAEHMALDKKETAPESLEGTMSVPISRRDFIRWGSAGVGVAAALPLFGGSVESAQAMTSRAADSDGTDSEAAERERQEIVQAAADEALSLLVAPIAIGTKLGAMRVEAVRVDKRGVGIVELTDGRGRNYLAEICRRTQQDARVNPLAATKNYSVFLYNNGSGSVPTDEKVGQAVLAVSARVKANEKKVEVLALRSRKELWQAEGYVG